MNIIEEKKLNEIITNINNYQKNYSNSASIFENITSLDIDDIQEVFYQNDLNFFDDVSFIISVIASIISHPHLDNTGEDIIIRADLAGSISRESFQKVFKDPSLWKEKDQEMVPEYVHHHQYTDEIKTYENIFIGMIIKVIDNSLINYSSFYASLLPSVNAFTKEKLESEEVEKVLNRIDYLKRKMMYIKNTHFYREISKCDLKLKTIVPTNILIKDRLYNFCYKFYRDFIKYTEADNLETDYQEYYFYHLLKVLKEKEFKFIKEENNIWYFNYQYFKVSIKKLNTKGINLSINLNGKITTNHNLIIDVNTGDELTFDQKATSNNVISIWNLKDQEGIALHQNSMKTKKLITRWLDSKFILNQVQKSLYTKYCPVCKNRSIEEVDHLFKCSSCEAEYTFVNDDTIWFCKTRSN